MEIQITKRQRAFIEADAAEVLFGGAAGGGKSHGQIVDALIYALRYPHSRQLLLRRTYPELEMSLVRTALALYPRELYSYAASRRMGRFANGSTLDFGYCDSERDVYRYQSAEYDVIRFDELTHFTFGMYRYLLSRLRGTRGYPKQVKSTTNPGGPRSMNRSLTQAPGSRTGSSTSARRTRSTGRRAAAASTSRRACRTTAFSCAPTRTM